MKRMNAAENLVYNDGERLIPWVTHSEEELVRHRSSYEFFKAVIERDTQGAKPVVIVDLGYGTGHGCQLLSRIPGARVIGIDNAEECQRYASKHYGAHNIDYRVADIAEYLKEMEPVDYVISRGVIEHVPDGIAACINAKYHARMMIDVPYREPAGVNPHHILSEITEKDFERFVGCELLFEEMSGEIYYAPVHEPWPNMILCAMSRPGFKPLREMFTYPIPPHQPSELERRWYKLKNAFYNRYTHLFHSSHK
ncbi:MAG: class I SAM-dependent methyltransferase [Alphaproteobacteria bacterium]|nr:class I SAM-dependent methyltransferase [Alphaproteobacteria bacterium]